MAKHYLVAIEEKDEKLFRLFCEKNSKYAMAIGKETTSESVRLDYVVYILNVITNQIGKSLGMKDWDNLRYYLKRKVKEYCPEFADYSDFKYHYDLQFEDDLSFPMNKKINRR
tara:strand:+ start:1847 stop:2185 length:339 start_codon:yes stop_codon:yes gene_type:complete